MADNKPKKSFIKDFKAELKRVIWPTGKQTAKNTIAVIFLVFIVSFVVLILDFGFRKGYDFAVDKVTGGKITAQKQEQAEAKAIIEEMKQYVGEDGVSLYQQLYAMGYTNIESLRKALEEMKNPSVEEETNTGNAQVDETNQEQPVEETPLEEVPVNEPTQTEENAVQ